MKEEGGRRIEGWSEGERHRSGVFACNLLGRACLDSSCTAQLALCVLEGSPTPWGPLRPQLPSLVEVSYPHLCYTA